MIDIPYISRILIFALLIFVLLVYERVKRPESKERVWEYGGLIVAGLIGAVYGVVNDAITFSISPEYFIYGKELDPGPGLRWRALLLGAQAGFSAGAIACAIWHFIFRKQPAKERCLLLLRRCWIPFVCAGIFAGF